MRSGRVLPLDLLEDKGQIMGLSTPWMLKRDDRGLVRLGLQSLLSSMSEDLHALLEDAQDGRTRISQRVAMDSQRVDLLMGDRMTLQETVWIMEEEAYASREAWAY
ncbi:hypothetical protein Tco_1418520 [Tanacetum coccineum]